MVNVYELVKLIHQKSISKFDDPLPPPPFVVTDDGVGEFIDVKLALSLHDNLSIFECVLAFAI